MRALPACRGQPDQLALPGRQARRVPRDRLARRVHKGRQDRRGTKAKQERREHRDPLAPPALLAQRVRRVRPDQPGRLDPPVRRGLMVLKVPLVQRAQKDQWGRRETKAIPVLPDQPGLQARRVLKACKVHLGRRGRRDYRALRGFPVLGPIEPVLLRPRAILWT